MNALSRFKQRTAHQRRLLAQALLGTLAAMALTACGGGGSAQEEPGLPAPLADAPLTMERAAATSSVTMTKVSFTNSDGQLLSGYLFQDPTVASRGAAVVMMHGCSGIWSNGVVNTDAQPPQSALSHIHRRWGQALARAGYSGLLVDSFTPRGLTNECDNGTSGLNEATVRPRDALAGRQWLVANGYVSATRIALLGWSNGASAVMATMDRTNEGTVGAKPFKEAFAFYPGCGLINEFGGSASSVEKTTWLPYAPITLHHAATDPLYTDGRCANRVAKALALGASGATGNAVAMTVYADARHSFDQIDITKTISSPYTAADKDAQVAADASVMARLAAIFTH